MAVIDVHTQAEFLSALGVAQGGDVINMAAGDYGDVAIKGRNFAQDITIVSADQTHSASFHTLDVGTSSGIDFTGVNVIMTPTVSTVGFSAALYIHDSSNISFSNAQVMGGKAITGVLPTADKLDGSGNVIGMDTGNGVSTWNAQHITFQNLEVSHLKKGFGIGTSTDVVIRGNYIHDVRTSTIVASGDNNLVIDGNRMSDSHPWDPGNGNGDHADFVHVWTDPKYQSTASHDIVITNNILEQGTGVAPLGIYFDDNGNKLGFTNVTVEGNVILNGVGQGIRLENVFNSVVDNNTLLQTSGTNKQAPGIIVADGSHDVDVHHNIASYAQNNTTGVIAHATFHDNTLVQTWDPTKAGYYAPFVLSQVHQLATTAGAHEYVLQNLGVMDSVATAAPSTPVMPPIVTPVIDMSFFSGFGGGFML